MSPTIRESSDLAEVPIVDPTQFVDAARDSGYRDAASAIAELIDNAIQASASRVEVLVEPNTLTNSDLKLAVLDDGEGISLSRLRQALQFGGTHRFNARSGLGRFGMGLPSASLSQARRVDVYSWTSRHSARTCWIDLDRILAGRDRGVRVVGNARLPLWLGKYKNAFRTAVVWTRCDRIKQRRIETLSRLLHSELGRLFRRMISNGLQLSINGLEVKLLDPIRMVPAPNEAQVELLPLIDVPFHAQECAEAPRIRIQFSILPVEEWTSLSNADKRHFRIAKWSGVSILREDREIAYGWFFLASKRRENYDDWWRCEVSFGAELDAAFGVTHTKQGIRPAPELLDTLEPIIGGQARRLNALVRSRFKPLRSGIQSAEGLAQARDNRLAVHIPRFGKTVQLVRRGRRYRIKFEDSPRRSFIRAITHGNELIIYINRLHPFYTRLYVPVTDQARSPIATQFNAFVLAIGRATASSTSAEEHEFLEKLSDTCAVFLDRA
jgi:hypothetical protein